MKNNIYLVPKFGLGYGMAAKKDHEIIFQCHAKHTSFQKCFFLNKVRYEKNKKVGYFKSL